MNSDEHKVNVARGRLILLGEPKRGESVARAKLRIELRELVEVYEREHPHTIDVPPPRDHVERLPYKDD